MQRVVGPNVRVKPAPTAWRAGGQAQKWAAGPALDGRRATLLGLGLNEGLGFTFAAQGGPGVGNPRPERTCAEYLEKVHACLTLPA